MKKDMLIEFPPQQLIQPSLLAGVINMEMALLLSENRLQALPD